MKFADWLLKEEEGVRSYKKPNPKNPQQNFVVLYGNTFAIKDKLKNLGFRYFQGTWSTLESKLTDEIKKQLIDLGVDLSGLDVEPNTHVDAGIAKQQEPIQDKPNKTDEILADIKNSLDSAIKSEGPSGRGKKLVDNIERMIEKIANSTDEAARQEFITNFLKFSSKFHNYSLANQMLIWAQTRGQAQHVASASNWTKLGRTLNNWDNPILIFAPNFKNVEKENPQSGEKEKVQLKFFKMVKVYDISSTVPIPGNKSAFNPVSRKDWSKDSNEDVEELNVLINSLINWIKEKNIKVDYEELSEEQGGYSSGGKIAINNKFKGINLFSTLVHETAHELLHWLEKKSNERSKLGSESTRREKEIDAETTAFIVSHHFGFDTKDAPNYLALWQAKGDDIRARKQNINKASRMIINAIEEKVVETEIEFEDDEIKENHKRIMFGGFIKDGRIFAYIDGQRRVFVTDAVYHDRWERMSKKNPEKVLNQILHQVEKGYAFEEK
jgi:hypothetical protein